MMLATDAAKKNAAIAMKYSMTPGIFAFAVRPAPRDLPETFPILSIHSRQRVVAFSQDLDRSFSLSS